jgi:hypothetical protein
MRNLESDVADMFRILQGCGTRDDIMNHGGMGIVIVADYWHARRSSGICNCGGQVESGGRCARCKAKRRKGYVESMPTAAE